MTGAKVILNNILVSDAVTVLTGRREQNALLSFLIQKINQTTQVLTDTL